MLQTLINHILIIYMTFVSIVSPTSVIDIESTRLPLNDITGTEFRANEKIQFVLPTTFIADQSIEAKIYYAPMIATRDPKLYRYEAGTGFWVELRDLNNNRLNTTPLNDYTIIFNYSGYSTTCVDFKKSELFYLNEQTNQWEFIPRSKNFPERNTLIAQTKKFGAFALASKSTCGID